MQKVLFCLCWLMLLFSFREGKGQAVRINEVMSSNASTLADEEGDFSDWIELYNAGSQGVSLEGWGLSDNAGKPFKWVFPAVTLSAGEYLLVWCSGKDYRPVPGMWVNGIKREVYPGINGTAVSALTGHPTYPGEAATHQLLKGKFESPADESNNFGQRMHGYLKAPATGSFTFYLASDDNGELWISKDTTVTGLQRIAEVPGWTNQGEWNKYPAQKSAPVFLEEGKMYYIMALAKDGTGGDHLSVGWEWPDGTAERPMPAKYLFWTKGELHTSFSISAEGEPLLLSDPQGKIISEMAPVTLSPGISRGLADNGILAYFDQPTPGTVNSKLSYAEILASPDFSHRGGYYDQPFDLTLSPPAEGVTIVYTLDGSQPSVNNLSGTSYPYLNQYRKDPGSLAGAMLYRTFRSFEYTHPLAVTDRSGEANQISRISTTYDANPWYLPAAPVPKAVVVRARSVREGALSSPVVSHTYFVRTGGTPSHLLPVISLSVQEDAFFDYEKGIYVAGSDFENWRSSNPQATADGGVAANYHRSGDAWEVPAHFELFDSTGYRQLGQNVGVRIHGNWSNANPFKSLRLYARNEYGKSTLDYPFFDSRPYQTYKRIILRNSGNDIWYTLFRDASLQEMVSHMRFETQAYQPSVMYLNGEYWGIHNIRERVDKYFLAAKFGVNEEQLDLLEGNMTADEGDNSHYAEMMDYLTLNGAREAAHYARVKEMMDTESFLDYMIAEIFMVNTDWPGNNIKYWRLQTPEYLPDAGPGRDGRWRWILYDADYSFGIYRPEEYSLDMMKFTTRTDGPSWPNPPWSTLLFRKLLENEEFKTAFIIRFCDQLNTAFLPEVVHGMIDGMRATIEPEMEREMARWKIPSSLATWYNNINLMKTFAGKRPAYARSHLQSFFALAADYRLTVDISGQGEGHVVVNTLPLTGATRGVKVNPYPWQGRYFRKMPLRLEAVAAPGYRFVRWESGNTHSENPILTLTPAGDTFMKAVFREEGVTAVKETRIPGEAESNLSGELFPNPFRENATIRLNNHWGGEGTIFLTDLQGRRIQQVYQGYLPAGSFSCQVDGSSLAPGIYFLVCETPGGLFREKIVRIQK
jgi:hypothetical protein